MTCPDKYDKCVELCLHTAAPPPHTLIRCFPCHHILLSDWSYQSNTYIFTYLFPVNMDLLWIVSGVGEGGEQHIHIYAQLVLR